MNKLEPKYLPDGTEVVVVEQTTTGFIVQSVYDHVYDGPRSELSEPFFVKRIFDTAPVERQAAQIAELEARIRCLSEQEDEIAKRVKAAERQAEVRLAKLKRYEALQYLEDVIDGKITHLVLLSYAPCIVTFDQALKQDGRVDAPNRLKLLTLYGGTGGDLQWNLHQYSDGSGGSYPIVPCISYEHAKEVLQKYLDDKIRDNSNVYYGNNYVELAKKYGLSIDPEYAAKVRAKKSAELYAQLAEASIAVQKIEAKMHELEERGIPDEA